MISKITIEERPLGLHCEFILRREGKEYNGEFTVTSTCGIDGLAEEDKVYTSQEQYVLGTAIKQAMACVSRKLQDGINMEGI